MDPDEQRRRHFAKEAAKLVGPLSDEQVREAFIKGLRAWRVRTEPRRPTFQIGGDASVDFFEVLGVPKAECSAYAATFVWNQREPWMAPIVEFISWMARTGLVIVVALPDSGPSHHRSNGYPMQLRLTRRGERLIDKKDEDHPLLPGFVERVRLRCPGIPEEVLAELTDARACLDHELLRAAVVLIGVAYEAAVAAVVFELVLKGHLTSKDEQLPAATKIQKVKGLVDVVLMAKANDEKNAVKMAYDFADHLRARRNHAGHAKPTYEFDKRDEIEEILVSAGRHLAQVWSMTT